MSEQIKPAVVTDADIEQMQLEAEQESGEVSMIKLMIEAAGGKMEKPDLADAPDGATVMVQNSNGIWVFGNAMELAISTVEGMWVSQDTGSWAFASEQIGWSEPIDWENSLVKLNENVRVVPLPMGKPTWDDAPAEANVLVGADTGWRFASFGAVVIGEDGFVGVGPGGYVSKPYFDYNMVEGEVFIEYRDGEPSQEQIEAMGKPSWDIAPKDATVLVRMSKGDESMWRFGSFVEVKLFEKDGTAGWVPADMDENFDTTMPGQWFEEIYYDISPAEVVVEYRPTVIGVN